MFTFWEFEMQRHLGGGITVAAIRGGIYDLSDVGRGRNEADDARTWRGGKGGADWRTVTSSLYIFWMNQIF